MTNGTPLDQYSLSSKVSTVSIPLFQEAERDTLNYLLFLYEKYLPELESLSSKLSLKYQEMNLSGYSAVFGDIEGELLYMLIREYKPKLVYEISPNAGYSTNYILAAVTRNGVGRAEGFEIIPEFGRRRTHDVIKDNLVNLCDYSRYNLNIGDARITTLRSLKNEQPDLVLIDSCHDDFFSEFYVKHIFPRISGIIFIQDICHFDPRPEFSSEALYVLSFLQALNVHFLPIGLYEDELNLSRIRRTLSDRRAIRSNSIVLKQSNKLNAASNPDEKLLLNLIELEEVKANSRKFAADYIVYPVHTARLFPVSRLEGLKFEGSKPEDIYFHIMTKPLGYQEVFKRSASGSMSPLSIIELSCLNLGRRASKIPQDVLLHLETHFSKYDRWSQVLIFELVAKRGEQVLLKKLLNEIDFESIRGGEIPLRIAAAWLHCGDSEQAIRWLNISRNASQDTSLAVGYRNLLKCARIYKVINEKLEALETFKESIYHIDARADFVRSKASKEVYQFILRNPSFLTGLRGLSDKLDNKQVWPALIEIFSNMVKYLFSGINSKLRRYFIRS